MPAWGDERSNGIKQLANDVYETPTNDGDGAANLPYPLQRLCPICDGIVTTADGGVTVSLGVTLGSVDAYIVQLTWQADPGTNSGDLYVVKDTDHFVVHNSGDGYGVKVAYSAVQKVTT